MYSVGTSCSMEAGKVRDLCSAHETLKNSCGLHGNQSPDSIFRANFGSRCRQSGVQAVTESPLASSDPPPTRLLAEEAKLSVVGYRHVKEMCRSSPRATETDDTQFILACRAILSLILKRRQTRKQTDGRERRTANKTSYILPHHHPKRGGGGLILHTGMFPRTLLSLLSKVKYLQCKADENLTLKHH
jgi:hypothetical protein